MEGRRNPLAGRPPQAAAGSGEEPNGERHGDGHRHGDPQRRHGTGEDAAALLRAGRDGDRPGVLARLEARPELARVADPGSGMTPLHQAARHGWPDVTRRLLALGADPNARNRWRLVPLHYAARFGHPAVARILLDRGADPGAVAAGGQTPLDWAIVFDRPAVVEVLLERGAPVGAFAAAGLGDVGRLQEYLDRDPGWLVARNEWGGTLLHVAALAGRREAVALLLARGADPAARDARGRTPRDHAREPAIRALLERAEAARGGGGVGPAPGSRPGGEGR